MGVVFLVLGVALDLFQKYAQTTKFQSGKGNTLSSLQSAMQMLAEDVRQSTRIDSPATVGASATELVLHKIDPTRRNHAGRNQDELRVRYWLSDGSDYPASSLLRETVSNSTTTVTEVARAVGGFQVLGRPSWPVPPGGGPNTVEIQLTLVESGRALVLRNEAMRPSF